MNTPESFIELLTSQASNGQKMRILKGDFTTELATAQISGENIVDKLFNGMTFEQLIVVYSEIQATLRNMHTTLKVVHMALDIAKNQAMTELESDTENNTKKSNLDNILSAESQEQREFDSNLGVLSVVLSKVIKLLDERRIDTIN